MVIAAGFCMQSLGKESPAWHGTGISVFGLGLLFLGIEIMSKSMDPMRDYPPFLQTLSTLEHPMLGMLAAAALTAIV